MENLLLKSWDIVSLLDRTEGPLPSQLLRLPVRMLEPD